MHVHWDVASHGMFDSEPLIVPGRFNFPQGAIYRLKITDIPGYPGVELYPTLEVAPTVPRTEAFIAHNFIPFQLTDDDFKQVLSGNFVTKVIYLPDPQYQELALAGVETLVSTRLDPGVDPIVEADRRGSILAIIRVGNKDLQSGGGAGPEGDVVQAGYWGPIPVHHPRIHRCRSRRTDHAASAVCRRDGCAGIRHAVLRYADRPAWPAVYSGWSAGRLAEARDDQRNPHAHSAADRILSHQGGAIAWHELSETGRPREDRRKQHSPAGGIQSAVRRGPPGRAWPSVWPRWLVWPRRLPARELIELKT